MIKNLLFGISFSVVTLNAIAQVTLNPVFATQDDVVTITYNATQGNAALTGVVPVYMHTGVILEGENGWQNVQGNWGTADNNVLMTPVGNNLHQKTINISQFYNLQPGDVVLQLAFVFRNAGGTVVGRAADDSDIFVDLYSAEFSGAITSPAGVQLILDVPTDFPVEAQTNTEASISLYKDDELLASGIDITSLSASIDFTSEPTGQYWLWMEASDGIETIYDSTYVILQGAPVVQNPPNGIIDGINYIDDNTVILQIFAPFKDFVYVLGDFNNWQFHPDYFAKKTTSGDRFWVELNDLTPGQEYRFQYSIDLEDMRVADIYAEKILDPWNDQWISEETYPGLIDYPNGLTTQIVSVLQTAQQPYDWQVTNFQRPPRERMTVYELLIRDFTEEHTFQSLIDTLGYLERLGINAIQLMPVQEFEGNESWGYNPMFYFAIDKYYGPKDDLKKFIDECHSRGIAVILDVVFNHSFGQNPQVRMYSENGPAGPVTAQSPYFNIVAKHPFNVGYDYNHDAQVTQAFMKRNMHFLIQEFKFDGFRFDLSKGFTQNNTLGNVGAWSSFDQSRINHWLRIKNEIAEVDPGSYLILEHFAANNEETVLANNGFMLWGNLNHDFNEATMGYSSNLNWANYQARGWNQPNIVSYAESHDEERLMFKNIQFGNQSNQNHDTRDIPVALSRMEASAALNIPLIGPKMIWQFGELGYDYSINHCPDGTINEDCRTANKPIRWDYYSEPDRQRLYKVYSAINKLKRDNEAFSSTDYTYDVAGFGKRLIIEHPTMDVVIIANFSVNQISMVPGFTHTGVWYDYFAGESITENNLSNPFLLQPGEYRIYTDVELETPDISVGTEEAAFGSGILTNAYPNPFYDFTEVSYTMEQAQNLQVRVLDLQGRTLNILFNGMQTPGNHLLRWAGTDQNGSKLANGIYLIQFVSDSGSAVSKLMLQR
jgi:1,4-alpha-glucan branching enzyme